MDHADIIMGLFPLKWSLVAYIELPCAARSAI